MSFFRNSLGLLRSLSVWRQRKRATSPKFPSVSPTLERLEQRELLSASSLVTPGSNAAAPAAGALIQPSPSTSGQTSSTDTGAGSNFTPGELQADLKRTQIDAIFTAAGIVSGNPFLFFGGLNDFQKMITPLNSTEQQELRKAFTADLISDLVTFFRSDKRGGSNNGPGGPNNM